MKAKMVYIVAALVLIFSLAAVVVPAAPAMQPVQAATTWYVNPGESIQGAVDTTIPGDTIIVRDEVLLESAVGSQLVEWCAPPSSPSAR